MKIQKQPYSILMESNPYFSLSQTLRCGQTFRFVCYSLGENFTYVGGVPIENSAFASFYHSKDNTVTAPFETYSVIAGNKHCYCFETEGRIALETDDTEYFFNYFDLDTDYQSLCASLREKLLLCKTVNGFPFDAERAVQAVNLGCGIRILKQEKYEMLISFIVSANNNIPRIKKILNAISQCCGTLTNGYYSFPTPRQLGALSATDFKALGAGYRAEYLVRTNAAVLSGMGAFSDNKVVNGLAQKNVKEQSDSSITQSSAKDLTQSASIVSSKGQKALGVDLESIAKLSTPEASAVLRTLMGVGEKVADCIMLFGYHKTDLFPVDVWIRRAYQMLTGDNDSTEKQIRSYFTAQFGELAGYLQQYLFFYCLFYA